MKLVAWFAVVAIVAGMMWAVPAEAAEKTPTNWPCPGCLAVLPPGDAPAPVLVLLHGDGQSAATLFEVWHAEAARRGVALLGLACPVREGCAGSWWRWGGAPEWIGAQLDALGARRAVDAKRVWLVGWSGGASYAGWRTQALETRFTALVMMGGGVPPADARCSESRARVYFLVGDSNPLHPLARRLREHYDACGQEVVWRLLRGADHPGEWAAARRMVGPMFDWLEGSGAYEGARRADAR